MIKLLQSDWLRGVQLYMIFVMAGGAGNQNNKNPIWRRNLYCINKKVDEFN